MGCQDVATPPGLITRVAGDVSKLWRCCKADLIHASSLFSRQDIAMQGVWRYLYIPMKIEWQTNIREDGVNLQEAIALRVPAAPRAFVKQTCRKGRVSVANGPASAEQKVSAGDDISVNASARFLEFVQQSQIHPAQILYEDKNCVVLNKPAGIAVHRAVGHEDNLLSRLQKFYRLRGETFQIAPIQRLDLGTSGIVLFGKGRASTSQLGKTITAGLMTKRYLALVAGRLQQPNVLTSQVRAKGKVKDAETFIQAVDIRQGYTLLDITLGTGRQHQIRQHLAGLGFPIVGDFRYSGAKIIGLDHLFLHCHQLTFPHPVTSQPVEISCPLPEPLLAILETL